MQGSFSVKIINPRWPSGSLQERVQLKFPVLGVFTLASLFPNEESGYHVTVADEAVESLDLNDSPDLVCITTLTPLAPRAYAIADHYRERSIPVLLGGIHVSALPREGLEHADAVVVGEAEGIFPRVLDDFESGQLGGIYSSPSLIDLCSVPRLRQDLMEAKSYFTKNMLQTTRGCPHDCEFCTVTAYYGNSFRRRPMDAIEQEIQSFSRSYTFVVDDNIIGHREHALNIFRLLREHNIRWWGQSSLAIADRPELLKACAESGCIGLFLGFESLEQRLLDQSSKRFNRTGRYLEIVSRLHEAGLGVQGSFVFGLDDEDEGCFDRFLTFADRAGLDAVLCGILTPFPGTRLARRMEEEGRILHRNWEHYDTQHVVYRPKGMKPETLYEGYRHVMLEIHREPAVRNRLSGSSPHESYYLTQNRMFGRAIRDTFDGDGRLSGNGPGE